MPVVSRSLPALVACLSLVAAGFTAPLMHVHDDAAGHGGHHGRLVHSHGGSHTHPEAPQADGPTAETSGEESEIARALDVFHMVAGWSQGELAGPPAVQRVSLPAQRTIGARRLVQHGHDPPDPRVRPSRAPPSLPL